MNKLEKLYQEVSQDIALKHLLKESMLGYFLRVIAALSSFLCSVLIAKIYGASGVGIYHQSIFIIGFSIIVVRVGLDTNMLRLASNYYEQGEYGAVKSVLIQGISRITIHTFILSFLIFILSDEIAVFLGNATLTSSLKLTSLAIIPSIYVYIFSEMLKAIKKPRQSVYLQGFTTSVVCLLIIFIVISLLGIGTLDISNAVLAYTIAVFVALILAIFMWGKYFPYFYAGKNTHWYEVKISLVESRSSLFLIQVLSYFSMIYPLFILGKFVSSSDVGIFSTCIRISMLLSFILYAVNTVVSSQLAILWSQKKINELSKLASKSSALLTLLILPPIVILLIFPEQVLTIFGSKFVVGKNVLRVMLVGDFINIASGSVGQLLLMSGHAKYLRNAVFLGVLCSVISAFILIPLYGTLGSAISYSLGMACLNIRASFYVKSKLGVIPSYLFRKAKN